MNFNNKKQIKRGQIIDEIKNNFVRQSKKYIDKMINLKKIRGYVYYYLHICIIILILFITLFSTSLYYLIVIILIVSLDGISIIYLHECPLTTMEKKYLGYSSCDERDKILKELNIMYNCEHTYEKQIELLINIWCIIAFKCLLIIFFNTFNIKLTDANKIYS